MFVILGGLFYANELIGVLIVQKGLPLEISYSKLHHLFGALGSV